MSLLKYLALFFCATLLLVSCQFKSSTEDIFDNYLYRLSNSLEVEQNKIKDDKQLLIYPKKTTLMYDIPATKVNVLQFLQLSKCDLQRLVGERNSSLGRLITGYHSLLYEHQFLLLAKHCQKTIEPSSSLYQALTQAIEHKENYRDKLYWNAIFATDELQTLFSLGSKPLSYEQLSNNPIKLITALEYLITWLKNPTANSPKLQQAYQVLASRKYIGELRLTMAMAQNTLTQANTLIEARLSHKPLCRNQQGNRKFEVVNRVFQKFYIGDIQPVLAKLHQRGQQIFSSVDQLQASLTPNKHFIRFWNKVYRSEDSEWQRFNQAILLHTKQWQSLLAQCGSSPQ